MAADGESRGDFSDAELGRIARQLREISHGSSWSRTLAIGKLILGNFFLGKVEEWRTHRRQKEASIRRLAQRSDCPLGKSALSEAVAIYVARDDLPAFVEELTPSHIGLALRLPSVQRLELLRKAHVSGWSVRVMRGEVLALKKRAGERRGRPRFSQSQAALSFAVRSLDALRETVALLAGAQEMSEETFVELERTVSALERSVGEVRSHLANMTTGAEGIRGIVKTSIVVPTLPASRAG